MTTKIIVIVGVSVLSVAALVIGGLFLNRDDGKGDEQPQSDAK